MSDKAYSAWIGFDPREAAAFAVAKHSAKRRLASSLLPIRGIVLDHLRDVGLYRREVQVKPGPTGKKVLWDPISGAPMATEFAISRFIVPHLAKTGWALFMDCDVLVMGTLTRIFDNLDPAKAIYCVKRPEMAEETGVKMDGQIQAPYRRKNWSSVCIWNCDHPSVKRLSLEMINTQAGRYLHSFDWIPDSEIGALDPAWNHLVDIDPVPANGPLIAHFTLGTPDMEGHDGCSFASEWWAELAMWASSVG